MAIADRTARKNFVNASHGEEGAMAVLLTAATTKGRIPVLATLAKTLLRVRALDLLQERLKAIILEAMIKTDTSFRPEKEFLFGNLMKLNKFVFNSHIARLIVEKKIKYKKHSKIPGTVLEILYTVTETLNLWQFCEFITQELSHMVSIRQSDIFWDLLEREFTRDQVIGISNTAFACSGRCLRTGVYTSVCRCDGHDKPVRMSHEQQRNLVRSVIRKGDPNFSLVDIIKHSGFSPSTTKRVLSNLSRLGEVAETGDTLYRAVV